MNLPKILLVKAWFITQLTLTDKKLLRKQVRTTDFDLDFLTGKILLCLVDVCLDRLVGPGEQKKNY